jgi:hypothetical protein
VGATWDVVAVPELTPAASTPDVAGTAKDNHEPEVPLTQVTETSAPSDPSAVRIRTAADEEPLAVGSVALGMAEKPEGQVIVPLALFEKARKMTHRSPAASPVGLVTVAEVAAAPMVPLSSPEVARAT